MVYMLYFKKTGVLAVKSSSVYFSDFRIIMLGFGCIFYVYHIQALRYWNSDFNLHLKEMELLINEKETSKKSNKSLFGSSNTAAYCRM